MDALTLDAVQETLDEINPELKNDSGITLHLARTTADRYRAAEAVTRAFKDYALFLWMFEDYDEKVRTKCIDFIARLNGSRIWHSGFVLLAKNSQGEVCGSSYIELRPKMTRLMTWIDNISHAMKLVSNLFTFMGSPLYILSCVFGSRKLLKRVLVLDTLENEHLKVMSDSHIYLLQIAADPKINTKGTGSTILRFLERLGDKYKFPIYLETDTDRLRVLYERFGFNVETDYIVDDGENPFKPNFGMVRMSKSQE